MAWEKPRQLVQRFTERGGMLAVDFVRLRLKSCCEYDCELSLNILNICPPCTVINTLNELAHALANPQSEPIRSTLWTTQRFPLAN